MKKSFEMFIDGGSSGNPGDAAIGIVISEGNKVVKKISRYIGKATNNIAEYMALIYGLQEALILKADKVKVHTDSELLYHQLNGSYKVKNAQLRIFYLQVQHLLKGFKTIEIQHIPREQNREADRLASKAIKKEQAKVVALPLLWGGEESPSSEG